jgi:sugar-specific transcriptional regulator TrmB/DNA-binding CsgD family transcriptional regulator
MGVLSVLGLDDKQHRLYDALTALGSASERELATSTGLPAREVGAALGSLRERGLVEASLGSERRWAMTPPEPALDALVHEHQQALARVRAHAQSLAERVQLQSLRRRPEELVAIAEGTEGVNAHFEQLQRAAQQEVLVFDRPPYPRSGGVSSNPLQDERILEGVTYRVIYDASMLDDAGILRRVKADLDAGVRGRVMHGLPLKLAVADRTMAMLPLLVPDERNEQSALVVRASVLLDSLVELFEALWDRALPLQLDAPAVPDVEPVLVEVIRLLASGMTDAGIARYLDASERTVRRRVSDAMDVLGASSRLQAGMLAERQGWLKGPR